MMYIATNIRAPEITVFMKLYKYTKIGSRTIPVMKAV